LQAASTAIGIPGMDGDVLESEILKRSKDLLIVTNRERQPGTLKEHGVIAKEPNFDLKCN
jgi:hypothetical protein